MKKKLFALALACAMSLSLLAGCGSSTAPSTTGSGTTSAPGNTASGEVAQEVNLMVTSDPGGIDPTKAAESVANTIIAQTQEGLFSTINGKAELAGAESYTTSEDGLVWTFKLKSNKWSDGKPVTANDYVYAIKRLFDPKLASGNSTTFYSIKGGEECFTGKGSADDIGAKAIDDMTLEITLKKNVPYFAQLLCFAPMVPLREDVVAPVGDTYGTNLDNMLFSGPFIITEWTKDAKIVLEKNPNYWNAGNVKITKAIVNIVPERATQEQLFESGKADVFNGAKQEYVDKIQAKIDSGEYTKISGAAASTSFIAFNCSDEQGVLSNEKIRKALSITIDREAFVNNVNKSGRVAKGFIPYGIAIGDQMYRDAVPEMLDELTAQDPKKLLEEGAAEIGKKPEEIEITFLQRNADSNNRVIGEFFQSQWQTKLGIKVNIDTAADAPSFNTAVVKGQFQIAQTGWGADYNDPMTFMEYLYGNDEMVKQDVYNVFRAVDDEYNKLVEDSYKTTDMAERTKLFARGEEILIKDKAYIAALSYGTNINLVSKRVSNIVTDAAYGPSFELRGASVVA